MRSILEKLGIFTVMYGESHIEGHSLGELEMEDSESIVKHDISAILFPPHSNLLKDEFYSRKNSDELFAVSVIDVDGIHRSSRNLNYVAAFSFIATSNPMSADYVSIYLMDSAVPYAEYCKDYEINSDHRQEDEDELAM